MRVCIFGLCVFSMFLFLKKTRLLRRFGGVKICVFFFLDSIGCSWIYFGMVVKVVTCFMSQVRDKSTLKLNMFQLSYVKLLEGICNPKK